MNLFVDVLLSEIVTFACNRRVYSLYSPHSLLRINYCMCFGLASTGITCHFHSPKKNVQQFFIA